MKLKSILSVGLMMAVYPSWALDFGRIPENEISVYVQELDSGKSDCRNTVPMNCAILLRP